MDDGGVDVQKDIGGVDPPNGSEASTSTKGRTNTP